MKSALAIQCLPKINGSKEEAYRIVDAAIAVIEASGLSYQVGPMETVVEGPLDELIELIKKTHLSIIASGSPSVSSYIKLVSSPDLGSSEEKITKYRAQGH